MAITSEKAQPAFTIPTVNLKAYLANPTSPEAAATVKQIRDACATSGFFQITGHGISSSLPDHAFAAARAIFALSNEQKRKLSGKPGQGYEIFGTQTLEIGKKPDLKDVCGRKIISVLCSSLQKKGYFISRESSNYEQPSRPFREPNIWPFQLPESVFRDPLLECHRALLNLSFQLMRICAKA